MTSAHPIAIQPLTRLEGHGKVTIQLDAHGEVARAFLHITQFRGFEGFCRGRPFEEMPVITQRICGICPVSHQLAAAKACDAICGVTIPPAARCLRELLHMGQFIQSHALHFFHLASPDLLLGWDADPACRNLVGLMAAAPALARSGIRLRQFGQEIIGLLGGKKIHPVFAVPGGVTHPLPPQGRDRLQAGLAEAVNTAETALSTIKGWIAGHLPEVRAFANFPSHYLGLVDADGAMQLYDGQLRLRSHGGACLAQFDPADYLTHIAEHVEPWSYMKFPYYRPQGYPDGAYRVGPLARLNVVDRLGSEAADAEWVRFRRWADDDLRGASLLYHYARLIELRHCLERARTLLADPAIVDRQVRITAAPTVTQGVGVIEAPRGTLIHHYAVDPRGTIENVNLIVATGHNNIGLNHAVTLVAKAYIRHGQIRDGLLNRVEGAIRCYDPCLSCATHLLGPMGLTIRVLDHGGRPVGGKGGNPIDAIQGG